MNTHANARLTPLGRRLLCERIRLWGWTVAETAAAANISERTAYRWLARYDAGEPMTDRCSRPRRSPTRTPEKVEAVIERLRRSRITSSAIAAASAPSNPPLSGVDELSNGTSCGVVHGSLAVQAEQVANRDQTNTCEDGWAAE